MRAIITLTMWELWKHRHVVIFDGVTPLTQHAITKVDHMGRSCRTVGILKGELDFFFGSLVRWVTNE